MTEPLKTAIGFHKNDFDRVARDASEQKFWDEFCDVMAMTDEDLDKMLLDLEESPLATIDDEKERKFREEIDYCKRELEQISRMKKEGKL